jgi:hypothetical protein
MFEKGLHSNGGFKCQDPTSRARGGCCWHRCACPVAGSWSGGGTLSTTDGNQERLRCRASYDVGGTGAELHLSLRCASESYNFDLASDVQYRGGAISGSWSEASRNASGTLSGRAAGDRIEASARSESFSAELSLTTRGDRQTVSIRPQGTNIAGVSLTLQRH